MNNSSKQGVTWTNGAISLTSDFIFGVSVLSEGGWMPLSHLDADDLKMVRRYVDHNPSCPFLDTLYAATAVTEGSSTV